MAEDTLLNALGEPMPDPNTPTEYTWSVEALDHIDTANYTKVIKSILIKVVSVAWDGTSAYLKLRRTFNITNDFEEAEFIPYDSLSEQNVLDWVQDELAAGIYTQLEQEMEDRRNNWQTIPKTNLPWND